MCVFSGVCLQSRFLRERFARFIFRPSGLYGGAMATFTHTKETTSDGDEQNFFGNLLPVPGGGGNGSPSAAHITLRGNGGGPPPSRRTSLGCISELAIPTSGAFASGRGRGALPCAPIGAIRSGTPAASGVVSSGAHGGGPKSPDAIASRAAASADLSVTKFMREIGARIGVTNACLQRAVEALTDEGIMKPEDIGALAPGGIFTDVALNTLIDKAGEDTRELYTEAAVRARQLLLPMIQRRALQASAERLPQQRLMTATPKWNRPVRRSAEPPEDALPPRSVIRRIENRIKKVSAKSFSIWASDSTLGTSLKHIEHKAMEEAIDRGIALLMTIGDRVPRLIDLHAIIADNPQMKAANITLMRDVAKDGIQNAQNLRRIIHGAETFIKHALAMNIDLRKVLEWDIAVYLQVKKGTSKRAPAAALRSITWLSNAGGFEWPVRSPLVRAQSVPDAAVRSEEDTIIKQAACPSLGNLAAMEDLVFSAPSVVLKIFAGFVCLLAHGCLRYADAQHSTDVHLTTDAIIGSCWKMKKRKGHVRWAALRVGVTGQDWGSEWISHLRSAGLPGKDFIVQSPSPSWTHFKNKPASYNDVASAMRALLLIKDMPATEALCFTPHSWRHVYPTLGRQLQLSDEQMTDVGHWTVRSGMPRRYDAAACVTELAAKSFILSAVAEGWKPVPEGCVPCPAPQTPVGIGPTSSSSLKTDNTTITSPKIFAACDQDEEEEQIRDESGTSISPSFMLVINTESSMQHIYTMGTRTACGVWTCGTPQEPVDKAIFHKTTELKDMSLVCQRCKLKHINITLTKNSGDAASSSSADSSSSSSSSIASFEP